MCRALVIEGILTATEVEEKLSIDDVFKYYVATNLVFDARNRQTTSKGHK